MAKNYKELLKYLRIKPNDDNYYLQALTHQSYTNEHEATWGDYQRAEFMGDAVIELVITKYIFGEYAYMDEGSLSLLRSNLVRMETLASLAKEIGLGDYILLGSGEAKSQGQERPSLLCDVYEALVAAIYLDQGYNRAESFIFKQYRKLIAERGMESFLEVKDAKSQLQELVQADSKRSLSYLLISSSGPANHPTFEMAVKMDGKVLGTGTGTSKNPAEQAAAKDALNKLVK